MHKSKYRIVLAYKSFSKNYNISHSGMGVTAIYTAKTLCKHGYRAQALEVKDAEGLQTFLRGRGTSSQPHNPVTHVVVMAQFMSTEWLRKICLEFPDVRFAMNCHSNIGFLQAEPKAITLIREAMDLETTVPNFHASGNNSRYVEAMERAYGRPLTFLPNLYYLHGREPIHRPRWHGGVLKIGAFGSHRVYKNFSTAINAAMIIGHDLKCPLEIWINAGRNDGTGKIVYETAKAWTRDVPNVELKELHWRDWPGFKAVVGTMNLLLQSSYSETFNNVTADGASVGVSSVTASCIDWSPKSWQADNDDSVDVANVGRRLITDCHAPHEGYHRLQAYVQRGLHEWKAFLRRK